MRIKNKIFLMLFAISAIILCFSYVLIYRLFHQAMTWNVIQQQQTVVDLNTRIINHFADYARQYNLLLAGDTYLGQSLSTVPSTPLEQVQTRELIQTQISHYANSQPPENYFCQSTLFLNHESVPLSKGFEANTLDTVYYNQISNIFSDELVKDQDWYLHTLDSPRNFYAFINSGTDEFCIAQKFSNAYYRGSYHPDGQGVLVLSIHMDQIEQTFNFSTFSPNSAFALLNHNGELLYSNFSGLLSDSLQGYTSSADGLQNTVTLDNEEYLVSANTVNYQMSFVFMTPYSDINHTVAAVMRMYALFSIGILVLLIIAFYILSCRVTKPIIYMANVLGSIEDTRSYNSHVFDSIQDKELSILCQSFNQLVVKIKEQDEKEKIAELKMLQAQINPHFIFNAMDVVNWIALSRNEDDIADAVGSIANLMRYSITDSDQMVDIHLELKNIQEFISIYRLRHNSHILLNTDIPPDSGSLLLPKFTIQPLVENSIRHGIVADGVPITILIRAYRDRDYTYIEVSDDGKGCDPDILNKFLAYEVNDLKTSNGFGIRNVSQRLQLNLGGNSGLFYHTDSDGRLTARIRLHNPPPTK